VSRFDWRRAIELHAGNVIDCLHAAEARKDDPAAVADERSRAQVYAHSAAWIARGYGYRHRLHRATRKPAVLRPEPLPSTEHAA